MSLTKSRPLSWLVMLLLLAAFLRIHQLTEIPPGLTHDEADHLLDAWGVVQGVRPIYFTVGYGREPLFDYSTAVLSSFLGPTYLAGRLTAVFYSLILIVGSYAWSRRLFGSQVALLTAAGLAVSFWALMIGRHSLRTITQPALFILVLLLWQMAITSRAAARRYGLALAAGILLGLTFYTYFPARIAWLLLPAALLLFSGRDRARWRLTGSLTAVTLMTALLVAAPLFLYLIQNRGVEARLTELSYPLAAVRQGEWRPLWENSRDSLALLTIRGDSQWRYNIPERPFVERPLIPFFYLGLLLCFTGLSGHSRAARLLLLLWLLLGWLPALITGPELSSTRLSALQPVLFIFPAIGIVWLGRFIAGEADRRRRGGQWLLVGLVGLLFGLTAVISYRDYFLLWGRHPEVRVQYESSLVAALRHLEQAELHPAAISTTTPEQFHSPAVAQAVLGREANDIRWFDGRRALLLPAGGGYLFLSQFAALNSDLQPYLPANAPRLEIDLPPNDLDRPLLLVTADGRWAENWSATMVQAIVSPAGQELPLAFDGAATFIGYYLASTTVAPGQMVKLVTLWQVQRPVADATIFVQLIGFDGRPWAQEDRLDVPSRYWQPGDYFLQLHQFVLPLDTPPGDYPLYLGLYERESGVRLPVLVNGTAAADFIEIGRLTVSR
jgi:4-amino-4-deoxy-L-arabinose transferase-like glycosyltransferase